MEGWECNVCGTQWSALHFSSNKYVTIKEGAPCAAGWFNACKGTIVKITTDEEKGHETDTDNETQ